MDDAWPPRIQLAAASGSGAASKYGARRTLYNGVWYASKLEADVARALDALMEPDGAPALVLGYEAQQEYVLVEKSAYGKQILYVADFVVDFAGPALPVRVVIETKGYPTDVYRLKRRLFLEKYGPDLLYEVRAVHEIALLAEEIARHGAPSFVTARRARRPGRAAKAKESKEPRSRAQDKKPRAKKEKT